MANHTEFVELANELLHEEGTVVTLQQLGDNSSNIDKPWLGTSSTDIAMQYSNVAACFIPASGSGLGSIVKDKDLLKLSQQVLLVVPVEEALEDKITRIKDSDGTIWKVVWSQRLKPAEQTILYVFGVTR